MTECVNCGATDEQIHQHHVNYARDETVPVCRQCHFEVHKDRHHELHPEDGRGITQFMVPFEDPVFERLEAEKGDRTWREAILEEFGVVDNE